MPRYAEVKTRKANKQGPRDKAARASSRPLQARCRCSAEPRGRLAAPAGAGGSGRPVRTHVGHIAGLGFCFPFPLAEELCPLARVLRLGV